MDVKYKVRKTFQLFALVVAAAAAFVMAEEEERVVRLTIEEVKKNGVK